MFKWQTTPAEGPPSAMSQVQLVPCDSLTGPRLRLRDAERGQAILRLANSLRQHGMIHPIVVEPREDGKYEVISGGRRCIAAREARMEYVPAVTRVRADIGNTEMFLVENEHRRSLDPLEFSDELKRMRDEGASLRDLARATGRSEGYCSNMLRLRQLPITVRELLSNGALSKGQGLAVLAAPPEHREALAFRAARGMTVREVEQEVTRLKALDAGETEDDEPERTPSLAEVRVQELVYELARRLGADQFRVSVRRAPSSKGTFTISFRDEDHLGEMLARVAGGVPEPPHDAPDFPREKSPDMPDAPDVPDAPDALSRRRFQPRRPERAVACQLRSPSPDSCTAPIRETGGNRRPRPP